MKIRNFDARVGRQSLALKRHVQEDFQNAANDCTAALGTPAAKDYPSKHLLYDCKGRSPSATPHPDDELASSCRDGSKIEAVADRMAKARAVRDHIQQ